MRINHNIPALIANNQLSATNANLAKSLQKLSSGKRINKAADDAAGLAISQKMDTQVRGLSQATRNANDGISVIQTAEGALNEVHSMLQRMRELAVQVSNGTYDEVDRASVQDEINQLNEEIQRISDTTEFNERKLLNGEIDRRCYSTTKNLNIVSLSDSVEPADYGLTVTQDARQAILVGAKMGVDGTDALLDGKVTEKGSGTININGEEVTIEAGDTADDVYEKLRELCERVNVDVFTVDDTNIDNAKASINAGYEAVTFGFDSTKQLVFCSKDYGSDQKVEIYCNNDSLKKMLGITNGRATGSDVQASFSTEEVDVSTLQAVTNPYKLKDGVVYDSGTGKYMTQDLEVYDTTGAQELTADADIYDLSTLTLPTEYFQYNGKYYKKDECEIQATDADGAVTAADVSKASFVATTLAEVVTDSRQNIEDLCDLKEGVVEIEDGGNKKYYNSADVLKKIVGTEVAEADAYTTTLKDGLEEVDGKYYYTKDLEGRIGFSDTATISCKGNTITVSDKDGFEIKFEPIVGAVGTTFTDAQISINAAGDGSVETAKADKSTASNITALINVLDAGPMDLQIGANEGQMMEIRIPAMTPKALGIDRLNLATADGAQAAITTIDAAINKVSQMRSKLGAYQNRLEHTVANLGVASENMTESLSRIEDADMAAEMSAYTQTNVLAQAGTSMLAKANEMPNTVLQLLQQ